MSAQSTNGQLGGLISTHKNKAKLRTALILLGVGVVLGGIGVAALSMKVDDPEGMGRNLITVYLIGAGVGVVLGLVGLFSLPLALLSMGNEVAIYEHGFTYKLDRKAGSVRWEEIRDVSTAQRAKNASGSGGAYGALLASDKKFTIHLSNGHEVTLTSANVPGAGKLAKAIGEHIKTA